MFDPNIISPLIEQSRYTYKDRNEAYQISSYEIEQLESDFIFNVKIIFKFRKYDQDGNLSFQLIPIRFSMHLDAISNTLVFYGINRFEFPQGFNENIYRFLMSKFINLFIEEYIRKFIKIEQDALETLTPPHLPFNYRFRSEEDNSFLSVRATNVRAEQFILKPNNLILVLGLVSGFFAESMYQNISRFDE